MVVRRRSENTGRSRLPRRLLSQAIHALAMTMLLMTCFAPAHAQEDIPPAFFSQRVNNNSPFVGQQVLYTLEFFARASVSAPHLNVNLEGVNDYELGGDTREEVFKGRKYKVTRLRRAFYPQTAGRLDIPPQRVEAGSLVSTDPAVQIPPIIETEPLTLVIRPLPPPPSPDTRSVTLVGSTTTLIDFDKSPLQVGRSRKLRIVVRSEGDLGLLTLDLNGTSGLRVYEAPPTLKKEISSVGLMLERTFSYEIIPLREGTILISASPFLAFDVNSLAYYPNSAVQIRVDTVKGPGSESAVPVPNLPENGETRAQIEKERLRYHEPNAMEDLLSHFSASSLLLIAATLSLIIITFRVHSSAKRSRRGEPSLSIEDLRKAETVADLHRNFREALLSAVAEEPEAQGLKQIVRASLSDPEQRIQVEAFLNDLAVEVYSTKDPSAKKFKALKARAVKVLETIPPQG